MIQLTTNLCPLCLMDKCHLYHQDKSRDYYQCNNCNLVYVPKIHQLTQFEEKAEYDLHQNDPTDSGYRRFLSRTLEPLLKHIAQVKQKVHVCSTDQKIQGLDFGCGPGPCISLMAKEQGIDVYNYDLYYFNDSTLLEKRYHFVTMTEVIEHIASPDVLLKQLDQMLLHGAILAIMTKRVEDKAAFANWHYKNDPTHISFYSIETFQWIAQKMSWRLEIIDKDVVFFHKS